MFRAETSKSRVHISRVTKGRGAFVYLDNEQEATQLAAQINAGAESMDAAAKERERCKQIVRAEIYRYDQTHVGVCEELLIVLNKIERGDHESEGKGNGSN